MAKILVSLDERLLRRIDAAARRLRLSRSVYLARLAERALETRGPGADPRARRALARIQELFAKNHTPGDPTGIIRRLRDERTEELGRRASR